MQARFQTTVRGARACDAETTATFRLLWSLARYCKGVASSNCPVV